MAVKHFSNIALLVALILSVRVAAVEDLTIDWIKIDSLKSALVIEDNRIGEKGDIRIDGISFSKATDAVSHLETVKSEKTTHGILLIFKDKRYRADDKLIPGLTTYSQKMNINLYCQSPSAIGPHEYATVLVRARLP